MAIIAAYMVPHPPMIVPEVGRGSERQVEATRTAYLRAAEDIAALQPETVIISSPHATMYADYFHLSPGREAAGSFARKSDLILRLSGRQGYPVSHRKKQIWKDCRPDTPILIREATEKYLS